MKEKEIRNRNAFNRYLDLVEKDVKETFDFGSFEAVNCPACGNKKSAPEFKKSGFTYVTCPNCRTLFVNPRPSFETLRDFYSKSPSTNFWVNEFFKPVAEARREKIFAPRAEYIKKTLSPLKGWFVGDVGAGFGLFLEELKKIAPKNKYVAIDPSVEMADICRKKGFDVKRLCLEEIKGMDGSFSLLTAFELLEHLYDPKEFLKKAYSLLKPGGYLFLTTLNGMGFDILVLWKKSKSAAPPQHLNLFNTVSIKKLLERIGFNVTEVSTPGKLDWDIVEGMINTEGLNAGRFWNYLAREGNKDCKKELQGWITKHSLSSHMRIFARKPDSQIRNR